MAASVRMLCRRSASLMTMTRRSFAIASRILRRLAALLLVSPCRFLRAMASGASGVGGLGGGRRVHARARLGLVAGLEVGQFQLGDAVHQVGDLLAELGGELVARDAAVLDDVMQQAGRQGRVVHLQLGQDQWRRPGGA